MSAKAVFAMRTGFVRIAPMLEDMPAAVNRDGLGRADQEGLEQEELAVEGDLRRNLMLTRPNGPTVSYRLVDCPST